MAKVTDSPSADLAGREDRVPHGRPGRRRRTWAAVAGLALAPVVAGVAEGGPESAASVSLPGAGSLHRPALAELLGKLDPGADEGWSSEVFSDAAKRPLEVVASWLQRRVSGAVPDIDLGAVVAGGFSCGSLRPPTLVRASDTGAVTVLRAVAPGAEGAEGGFSGPGGLGAALEDLAAPLAGASGVRASFKVIRVGRVGDGDIGTAVLFSVSGQSPAGGVQVNARWDCRWAWGGGGAPRLKAVRVSGYEEVVPRGGGGLRFVEASAAAFGDDPAYREQLKRGIDHWRPRLQGDFGADVNGLQGIAVGDADGDGREDIYLCQQGGIPNKLYLRRPDGTLRDASAEAGVDWMELSRAALFVDLDNDGDQDLAIAQGWYLMLMENEGGARFSKRLEERAPAQLHSLAAADADGDGDLDLFFCGRNPARELERAEGILGTPVPYHDANNGGANVFLENRGSWRFADATRASGLDVNNRRYSYAASWADFDGDGDPDLYVANDFGRNNLYRNDGGGRFTDVAGALGAEDISAGMGVTWGDYDNDGRPDFYVSNMFSSAGNRIAFQRNFRPGGPLEDFRRHARGNSLFRNVGAGGFEDVSVAAGVTMGRWAWGSVFVDFDNDGWEDLYVANGFITTPDPGDL